MFLIKIILDVANSLVMIYEYLVILVFSLRES